jgi:hypothetical protein
MDRRYRLHPSSAHNLMGDIGPTTADMVFGTSSELFKLRWGNDTPMLGTQAKLDRHETWKDARLLIVDKLFTMTGKHLTAIEQQLFLTMRDCGPTPDSSHSMFGGIGVILTGDHHQARRCVKGTGTSVMARRPTPLVVTQRTPNATAPDGTPSLYATRAAVLFWVSCTPPCSYKHRFVYLSELNDRLRGGRLTKADFDDYINACAIGAQEIPASIHHTILRNTHFMVPRHIVGEVNVHALLPRRAAKDQHLLIRWSAKDRMRTSRDDAWKPGHRSLPPRPPRSLDTQQDERRFERDVLQQRHTVHIPT